MPTSLYYKFNQFVQDIPNGVYNLATDQLAVALTNTAPSAGNTVYSNIVSPVGSTNFSGVNPYYITTTSSLQTSGVEKLILQPLTLTASGAVPTFRYVVVYDTVNSKLIAWFDYGQAVNMGVNEQIALDFDTINGFFQLT